jgi:hypothetical protein
LTPKLTPKVPDEGKTGVPPLPHDLAKVAAVWLELPPHIKAAVMALIDTYKQSDNF